MPENAEVPRLSTDWGLASEIRFLSETRKIRVRGKTWKADRPASFGFEAFAKRYLEGLAVRTAGWKKNSLLSDDDRNKLREVVMKLLEKEKQKAPELDVKEFNPYEFIGIGK